MTDGSFAISDPSLLGKMHRALRLATVSLPHFAGLAKSVRIVVDPRVETAGVFESGRLLINPDFVNELNLPELAFVAAHELYHLALQTHRRGAGTDPTLVNVAHDYIINDMLAQALGRDPPAGGLHMEGARHFSLESMVGRLRADRWCRRDTHWRGHGNRGPARVPGTAVPRTQLGRALREAGVLPPARGADDRTPSPPASPPPARAGRAKNDVLPDELEREWFPGETASEIELRREAVRRIATTAVSLGVLQNAISRGAGDAFDESDCLVTAVKSLYQPPWMLAMQRWFDGAFASVRTFAKASRRMASSPDIVLPGRQREAKMLHIILDTSGSMRRDQPVILGVIGAFCENVGIESVHILQCDDAITQDEYVEPEQLAEFRIHGLGGSDLTPAMLRLADDPDVTAAVVLTDGYISFPRDPVPYEVLWVVSRSSMRSRFSPEYGQVIPLRRG